MFIVFLKKRVYSFFSLLLSALFLTSNRCSSFFVSPFHRRAVLSRTTLSPSHHTASVFSILTFYTTFHFFFIIIVLSLSVHGVFLSLRAVNRSISFSDFMLCFAREKQEFEKRRFLFLLLTPYL